MCPGPNDYHVKEVDGQQILDSGLGKDEPDEMTKLASRAAGIAKMNQLKEELKAAGAELSERERKLIAQEEAAIAKERELEARERALAAIEKKAQKTQ